MEQDRQQERRCIVLGEDGRFVTLGRASDPTDEEIARAEATMRAQGVAGWVAVMSGNPSSVAGPALVEVRAVADPRWPFLAAVKAFRGRRRMDHEDVAKSMSLQILG